MAGAFPRFNGNQMAHILPRSNPSLPSLSFRPMMVTLSQHQTYWASITADIETHLKQAITLRPPLSVFEPMSYLAFSAPQTTAPALCVAACELVGGRQDQAMAAASALHLMHAATFTHEHLPLSDRPNPKPMIHHAFGPNIELLTADGLIPFGLELLARSDDPAQNNSDRVLRVIIEITRAMGSQGVIDGLYNEIQYSQSDCDNNKSFHVSKKKEGELYACGAACGAILGGANDYEIEKLRKYGLYVGMIQGMLDREIEIKVEKGVMKNVEELRNLALKELKGFNEGKVEAISSLIS